MKTIIGRTIVRISVLTKDELEVEGWGQPAVCLVLDDGTKLYPSQDEEGNGPGALFGMKSVNRADGPETFMILAPPRRLAKAGAP